MKKPTIIMLLTVTATLSLTSCPAPVVTAYTYLSALTVSDGTLSPTFSDSVTDYRVTVANGTTQLTVTATPATAGDTLSAGNGVPQALSVGANTVTLTVTAQGGTVTRNYVVTAIRGDTNDYFSANVGLLKYVPGGTFQRDATVTNTSTVSAFRIGLFEVNRAQYVAIMGIDPSTTAKSTGNGDPVQMVNWYHAITFCNKLSLAEGFTLAYRVDGVDFTTLAYSAIPTSGSDATWNLAAVDWLATGYRLPTEMEWMWAAMGATAGTTGYLKAFAGSTGSNAIGNYVWYTSNTNGKTHPTGTKIANELGLFDMSGNVWEWTGDWNGGAYPTGPLSDYRGEATGAGRIDRGGSWDYADTGCTVAFRNSVRPDLRYNSIGIRVVRQ